MASAKRVMLLRDASAEQRQIVEQCWAISEESEVLADFARQNLSECWGALTYLVRSRDPSVRWQVYDVLGDDGTDAEPLLRVGLNDADLYARRRAVLAMARLRPIDAKQISNDLMVDEDPYIRQAAIEMARAAGDSEHLASIRRHLLNDPVDHVRRAAQTMDNSYQW